MACDDHMHTEVQGWLRDLGLALGYAVWVASTDQSRHYAGGWATAASARSRHRSPPRQGPTPCG